MRGIRNRPEMVGHHRSMRYRQNQPFIVRPLNLIGVTARKNPEDVLPVMNLHAI